MKTKMILIVSLLSASFSFCNATPPPSKAVLWIPAESRQWEQVLDTLLSRPDFHLTIAVSSVSAAAFPALKTLVSRGQLEVAMRLAGDPVLPLLFYPNNTGVKWKNRPETMQWPDRPDEMVSRLSRAGEKHAVFFKEKPAGWVPEAGGVVPDILPAMRALGIKWIASGPVYSSAAEGGPVAMAETAVVPFTLAVSSSSVSDCSFSAGRPCFLAVDETIADAALKRDFLLSLINPAQSAPERWLTVSEAIAVSTVTRLTEIATAAVFAPWTQDYSLWAGSPEQYAALTNLNKARQALDLYITSGQSVPRTAKILSEEFIDMESGNRFLRLAGSSQEDAGEAEMEFQSGLSGIYRQIGRPVPASIFRPLAEVAAAETALVSTTRPLMQSGTSWITIQNPDKQLLIPQLAKPLPAEADPSRIWKINSIRLDWNDSNLKITASPAQTDNTDKAPSGFSHLLLDVYIDVNHRSRSGTSSFLKGRKARTSPEDAWEYAIVINGWKASLFKASPRGPVFAGSYKPELNTAGEISVAIPRENIKGNPLLWGYMAAAMALKNHDEAEGTPVAFPSGETLIDSISSERIRDSFYGLRLK